MSFMLLVYLQQINLLMHSLSLFIVPIFFLSQIQEWTFISSSILSVHIISHKIVTDCNNLIVSK